MKYIALLALLASSITANAGGRYAEAVPPVIGDISITAYRSDVAQDVRDTCLATAPQTFSRIEDHMKVFRGFVDLNRIC